MLYLCTLEINRSERKLNPIPPPDGDDPAEGLPISFIFSRNTLILRQGKEKTLTLPGYGRSVPLPRWSLGLGSNLHVCLCARDAEQVTHSAWTDLQEEWQVGGQSLKVDIILNWSDVVILLYSGKLKSLHTDNVQCTAGGATCVEINKLINPGSPLIWAPLWGIV